MQNCLQKRPIPRLRQCVHNFITIQQRWLETRGEVVCALKKKANEIDQNSLNINVGQLVGKGTSVVGACLGLASLAFPAVAAGGAVMFLAGQLTSTSLDIAQQITENDCRKAINKLIAEDTEAIENMKESLKEIDKEIEEVFYSLSDDQQRALKPLTREETRNALLAYTCFTRVTGSMFFLGFLRRGVRLVNIIFIPLAVLDLIKTIHQMITNPQASSAELRNKIQTLEEDYDRAMEKVKEAAAKFDECF